MSTLEAPTGAHDWETLKEPTMCAAFQRMWREVPDRVALRSIGGRNLALHAKVMRGSVTR